MLIIALMNPLRITINLLELYSMSVQKTIQDYTNYLYSFIYPTKISPEKIQELLDKARILGMLTAQGETPQVANLREELNYELNMLDNIESQEIVNTYKSTLYEEISRLKEEAKPKISLELATSAAKYWANFLPGSKDVCFSDINKHSKIHNKKHVDTLSVLAQIANDKAVSKDQYDNFVKILAQKILSTEFSGYSEKYIQLGHISSYDPPMEVAESMKEAGVYAMMPFKTEMRIYEDEHVTVNYETLDLDAVLTGCDEVKSHEIDYSAKLKALSEKINPHTDLPDLGAQLAIYDLIEKCKDSQYNDDYSKDKLVEADLYPWDLEDSASAVEALCGLLVDSAEL